MKAITYVIFLLFSVSLRAGMPDVDMPEATIDGVEKTPAGWVAIVSGAVTVLITDGNTPDKATFVTFRADKARVTVPIGNQLYSLKGAHAYESRLTGMVGKKTPIEMWGATITLRAGRVTDIIAGDVSFLRPQKQEAAFDIGRLMEIQSK